MSENIFINRANRKPYAATLGQEPAASRRQPLQILGACLLVGVEDTMQLQAKVRRQHLPLSSANRGLDAVYAELAWNLPPFHRDTLLLLHSTEESGPT